MSTADRQLARLIAELDRLAGEFAAEIGALATEQEIRLAQARYLGKKGKVSELMKALGKLPAEERPAVGEAANRAKSGIEGAVAARLAALDEAELSADLGRVVDVTLPARGRALGTLHPLTLVRREIEEIFLGLGFEVRTGPWIETEWNNFDALNTPHDHPARDMQDTFFVEGGRILRSHTSPVQIRTMLAGPPPVRIVAPGNVFRRDDDATHTPMFPQMEGLLVDRGRLVRRAQGDAAPLRASLFRPGPGRAPAAELLPVHRAVGRGRRRLLPLRGGRKVGPKACRLCKGTGWIEIGGAGMVHPNVFRAVGYDPREVSGFAFGVGLSRMAMLKYGVDDLRSFYEHDVRFLAQFR